MQRGNSRAGCGPKGFSSGGAEGGSPRHFQCRGYSSSALLFPHYSSHDKLSPVQETLFPLPSELISTCPFLSRAGPSLFGLVAVCIMARPFETGCVSAVPPVWLLGPGVSTSLSRVRSQDPTAPG